MNTRTQGVLYNSSISKLIIMKEQLKIIIDENDGFNETQGLLKILYEDLGTCIGVKMKERRKKL